MEKPDEVFTFTSGVYEGFDGLQQMIHKIRPGNVWRDNLTGYFYFRPYESGQGPVGILFPDWYIEFQSEAVILGAQPHPDNIIPPWVCGWDAKGPTWVVGNIYRYIKQSDRQKRLELPKTCPNCKFFQPDQRPEWAEKGHGYCQRFPPTAMVWTAEGYNGPQYDQYYPYMTAKDWCGEFILSEGASYAGE